MPLLFPPGSAFAQCHASTVVERPDGRLLVALFGGTRERDPDTAIWMVTGDGDRWEPPRSAFKLNDQPHWNPVTKGRTPLRLSLSHDNGLTWTRHRELATGEGEFSYPALIVTADGRLAATWTDRRTSIACWRGSPEDCTDTQKIRA